MKKIKLLALFSIVSLLTSTTINASEHHSGHGGGMSGGGGTTSSCCKPNLGKFLPPHLSTVVPEAEFSFLVFNIDKPEQVYATVKNIPVELSAEFRDPYYIFRGKLPAALVNTPARINITVKAKSPHCEAENGWLVIIADK